MTKRKKREPVTLSEIVFAQFAETGDVTGLGALADYHQERDEKPEHVALIRSVLSGVRDVEAVRFFMTKAGCSYRPDSETKEEGWLRVACRLADAELWLNSQYDASVDWNTEDELGRDHIEHDGPLWCCDVKACGEWESLGAVDFGEEGSPYTDHYARVVEAELALQLMTSIKDREQNPEI